MTSALIKKIALWGGCGVAAAGIGVGAYMFLASGEKNAEDMLGCVPAESDLVITFNSAQLLESTNSKLEDGKIVYSETVSTLIDNATALIKEEVGDDWDDVQEWIDFSGSGLVGYESAVFVANIPAKEDKKPEMYYLMNITDEKGFVESVENLPESPLSFDDVEGYKVSTIMNTEYDWESGESKKVPAITIAIKDNIAWMVFFKDEEKTVEFINEQLEKASEQSIVDVVWKKEFLAGKHSIAVLLDTKPIWKLMQKEVRELASIELGDIAMDKGYTDSYFQMWCDVEGPTATLTAGMVSKDGKKLQIPFIGSTTINSSFLKYLNNYDVSALSIAVPKGLDYKKIAQHYADLIGETLPHNFDEQLAQIQPYIKKIEGATITIGCGVKQISMDDSVIRSVSNYDVIAVATLQPGVAQEVLGLAVSKAEEFGISLTRTANGVMYEDNLPVGGRYQQVWVDNGYGYGYWDYEYVPKYERVAIYASVEGNDLVIANRPISSSGNTSPLTASMFDGKVATCVSSLPKNSNLITGFMQLLRNEFNTVVNPLPFGLQSQISINPTDVSWSFSITDNNGLLLDEIIKYASTYLD